MAEDKQRQDEDAAYAEFVVKETDKLQMNRIMESKNEFAAKVKDMEWYQRARSFGTTVYDLQDSKDPIYQNMNCMQNLNLIFIQFSIILHIIMLNR